MLSVVPNGARFTCGPNRAWMSSARALHPDRRGVHVEEVAAVAIADIAAVDHAPVRLLEPVAVDRIVEKEREIGEQVESIVLRVGIREETPA
ncbi:MAG: hypothetical protein U0231_09095 [Nitrospiraceae bacterium]